jgi:hypothetical protein
MRRIWVVDDDLHVCLAIKAWLGRYGLAVALDGTAGLVGLDNSIFDLVTLPCVFGESPGRSRLTAVAAGGPQKHTAQKAKMGMCNEHQ